MSENIDDDIDWRTIPRLSSAYLHRLVVHAQADGHRDATMSGEVVGETPAGYMLGAIGEIVLADKGFGGEEFELLLTLIGTRLSPEHARSVVTEHRQMNRSRREIPAFFRAIIERDRATESRHALDAILAVKATCFAFATADGRTAIPEMRAINDLYLKPLANAVIDARIAPQKEVDDLVYGAAGLTDFCHRLAEGSELVPAPLATPSPAGGSPDSTIATLLDELDDLIGLDAVKTEVRSLTNLVRVQEFRRESGLPNSSMSMHLVFTGNPGTGKTTVARIVARIYRAIGVLAKGQLVETDRSGLVAGYVGQTAIKAREVVDSAVGGVLFIDEAYSLADGSSSQDFGHEAIDTLLKQMEDRRDQLVVIVAGYPGKMTGFLSSNPGLQSRFNKYIHFDDYTPDEMVAILRGMCAKGHYVLTSQAETKATALFSAAYRVRSPAFGNGRFVRNIFEQTIAKQANRVVHDATPTAPELSLILPEDLPGESHDNDSAGIAGKDVATDELRPTSDQTSPDTRKAKSAALLRVHARQAAWASTSGVAMEVDRPDYALDAAGNLFKGLSAEWATDLNRGQGGELKKKNDGIPPKLCALHSSSALVANVFQYWRSSSLATLTTALNSPFPLQRMEAEAKFATGYGFPCNIDVALWTKDDDWVLAVESKFCEPLGTSRKPGLKGSYLPVNRDSPWTQRGLAKCDLLARSIQSNPERFEYLDSSQLLKHILGLHRKMGEKFQLLYLWYDIDGPAGKAHDSEVGEFRDALDGEVDFQAMTYQSLVVRLQELSMVPNREYFEYLKNRYRLG